MTRRKKVKTTKTRVNTFGYDPSYDGKFSMWVFTPFGLIMPCQDPAHPDMVTVRARDATHLAAFRERFCPELDKVVETPERDYDCRSLVSYEAFARAMARMALCVDSPRFNPLSEGPCGLSDKNKADTYHGVLNRVWGVVCDLSDKLDKWDSYYPAKTKVKL